MRLTLYTDYAVRMLMFVALRDGQRGTIRRLRRLMASPATT